jgi:hypothetical protein
VFYTERVKMLRKGNMYGGSDTRGGFEQHGVRTQEVGGEKKAEKARHRVWLRKTTGVQTQIVAGNNKKIREDRHRVCRNKKKTSRSADSGLSLYGE